MFFLSGGVHSGASKSMSMSISVTWRSKKLLMGDLLECRINTAFEMEQFSYFFEVIRCDEGDACDLGRMAL